jgi:F-type H+-transporting ATPase subunit alpha
MELLKQPQFRPYPFEEQAVSIWTGLTGKLDNLPVVDVLRFERDFLEYLRHEHGGILDSIRESRDWTDDTAQAVEKAYDAFADQFETSEGRSLKAGREDFDALADEDVEQEKIVKQKRG